MPAISILKTGKVWIERVNGGTKENTGEKTTTIEQLFDDAGKKWDNSNYSDHTFKFFYFERGAGGSNAKLRFNLQSIPQGKINFGKDVDYANLNNVSDIDFEFKTYVNYDGIGDDFELYTGSYEIRNDSVNGEIASEGDSIENKEGILYLKDGQFATLTDPDIKATSTFYIEE